MSATYNGINNSVINTGSVGGSIKNTVNSQNQIDTAGLLGVIEKITESLPALQLSEESKLELQAELKTVEAQAKSPKPKIAIIRECLGVIRRILEGAASNVLAELVMPFLQ